MSYIIHWNIESEAFNIMGFSIRYYSLFFGAGIFIAYHLFFKINSIERLSTEKLLIYILPGVVIGARLGHCLFYDPVYFLNNPIEMFLPVQFIEGHWMYTGYLGLASHGGAIGVLIALLIFARNYKISLLYLFDRMAIIAPLVGTFIRIGNFMNSEIVGIPTNSSYGIIFSQVDQLPRHPAQLYESFCYMIIFILLFQFRQRLLSRKGSASGLMFVLIFTARFFLEFIKTDQATFDAAIILNMGQLLSLPFIFFGFFLLLQNDRKVGTAF